jgi:hypothetical protein
VQEHHRAPAVQLGPERLERRSAQAR